VTRTHDAVARLITEAKSILVITGTGLAAECGLVHYRGFPGIQRTLTEDGVRFDVALAAETLAAQPHVTWKLLLEMDAAIRAVRPSRGHEVLVELEQRVERFTILTTNVDRMHQRAGSRTVIEMHGAMYDLACTRCELVRRHTSFEKIEIVPACATCGGVLRPAMPLIGEPLRDEPFAALQDELDRGVDLVLVIGVITVFPYTARPVLLAKQAGIRTVEIGQQQTDVSDVVDLRLRGSPASSLAAIYERFVAT
jgi:NAD-dependent deacetylase